MVWSQCGHGLALPFTPGRAPGERVRVGPKRSYRALVGDYDSPLEPKPAKPKPAPKKDAA